MAKTNSITALIAELKSINAITNIYLFIWTPITKSLIFMLLAMDVQLVFYDPYNYSQGWRISFIIPIDI